MSEHQFITPLPFRCARLALYSLAQYSTHTHTQTHEWRYWLPPNIMVKSISSRLSPSIRWWLVEFEEKKIHFVVVFYSMAMKWVCLCAPYAIFFSYTETTYSHWKLSTYRWFIPHWVWHALHLLLNWPQIINISKSANKKWVFFTFCLFYLQYQYIYVTFLCSDQ